MKNTLEVNDRIVRPSPVMTDQPRDTEEKSWWDTWNVSYRAQDDGGKVPNELFARTAALVAEVAPSPGGRVLEVACGAGAMSRRLRYSSYFGIDISPAAIDIARQKIETTPLPDAGATTYESADFHDWPLPPEPFDIALCVDAVAYFRDQAFALKKMAQSLRPHGVLVLTTINPFVYHRIKRTAKSPLQEGSISHWLTRSELHRLVESAGLVLEQSYTIMPRGNLGILRIVNAARLNHAFGIGVAEVLKRAKERIGLGQYRVVVARKRAE
jgi:2-polyprenyl-3-methyl-5-hydroxy-6-metoxy-1,4-benzoquinol methylase